jgi:hypothetical protein
MNYKIAAKGDANRFSTQRHLARDHGQESHDPPAFRFIDKRGV